MSVTSSDSNRDPFFAELLAFSAKALVRKTSERSPQTYGQGTQLSAANWHKEQLKDLPSNWSVGLEVSRRPVPLMPLRERDAQELSALFMLDEIDAIEADIAQNLQWRCPEPCWEDSPFGFLQEYL